MKSIHHKKALLFILLLITIIIAIIILVMLQSTDQPQAVVQNNTPTEEAPIGSGDTRTPEQIANELAYTDPGITLVSPHIQLEYDTADKAIFNRDPLSYTYPSPTSDATFTIMIGEEPVDCSLVVPETNERINSVMSGTWSLDGTTIAFTKIQQNEQASTEEGEFIANNIWIMDAQGKNMREVYVDPTALNLTYEIVGSIAVFATNYSIGTVNLKTGETKILQLFEAPISRSSEIHVPDIDIIDESQFIVEVRNLDYWQTYQTSTYTFSISSV